MAAARKPQDHKPKQDEAVNKSGRDVPFEFEHAGKTYTLKPANLLKVGFARKNRHLSELSQLFALLEVLADDDALEAIDDMDNDEFTEFQKAFHRHAGITVGE